MAWESMVPGPLANRSKYENSVSIQRTGSINWNKDTQEFLGNPERVKLMYDPTNKLIALVPVTGDEPGSFVIRQIQESSKSVGIGAYASLRAKGILPKAAFRVPLEEQDGLFVGDVSELESVES